MDKLHNGSGAGDTWGRLVYYPFGAVMEGVGLSGDWKFLYQSKESISFNGANLYDFNTRSYDAYLGRFLQLDGANQFASGYVGMGNMPTVGVDPDGQFAFIPILAAAIVGGVINGASYDMQGKGFGNGFWRGAIVGALGGVAGAFAPNAAIAGLGKTLAYGAGTGAGVGAAGAALNGGNIGQGALIGGLSGGLFSGIGWGLTRNAINSELYGGDGFAFNAGPGGPGKPWYGYAKGSRSFLRGGNIVVSAPSRGMMVPAPAVPWWSLWGGRSMAAATRATGILSLAGILEGDVPRKAPNYITMYRNMGQAEYDSFIRKGMNFGIGGNSLEYAKEFWMTPDGLIDWNSRRLAGPYNVTIQVPKTIVSPYGLVQQQILDGHLAGIVSPTNLNLFNKAKIVTSISKR
ncbi:hypothetical protein LAG90_09215 [Marinilongibacter aquaticus]|uniref:RHS repeat domain-containing protein n=1 Tax=Marinilongibacter aquaticus TaxID=2975157 RepID=UPI0021BDBDF0|nr:hypothetical protein [Marinilongibacter aquaticus]UBM60814.1 hypothetical protein LAG90_09215 [Marinilongibacter aquaticus]